MLNILEVYKNTLQRLGPMEGRWLFTAVTGLTDTQVLLRGQEFLPEEQNAELSEKTERRLDGEPLQYILGTQDFLGVRILCDPRALIPRLDTECVCEEALRISRERQYRTALDLCCGTGAIGCVLGIRGNLQVTLADLSNDALALAEENCRALGIKATIVQGDLFSPLQGQSFDLIVCNPPYIPTGDIPALDKEVREYEPHMALDGGKDGLTFYRRLAEESMEFLNPDGAVLCEIGMGQEKSVSALFEKKGFRTRTAKDLQGITRMVLAVR